MMNERKSQKSLLGKILKLLLNITCIMMFAVYIF